MYGPKFTPIDGLYVKFDMQHKGRDFVVTTRRHSFTNGVLNVVVPENFRCDLGSVPVICYLFMSPYGKAQRGFLFHDVLYRSRICTRYMADACLLEIHRADGVPWWQRTIVYLAVRSMAWLAWNRNRKSSRGFLLSLHSAGGEVQL